MALDFDTSAQQTEIVFIYADAMIRKLEGQAGVNAINRISLAHVLESGICKQFPYTHKCKINTGATDSEAVMQALGNGARFWADTQLKMLRVSPQDIIDKPAEGEYTPSTTGHKYYNATQKTVLAIDIQTEEPNLSQPLETTGHTANALTHP